MNSFDSISEFLTPSASSIAKDFFEVGRWFGEIEIRGNFPTNVAWRTTASRSPLLAGLQFFCSICELIQGPTNRSQLSMENVVCQLFVWIAHSRWKDDRHPVKSMRDKEGGQPAWQIRRLPASAICRNFW